MKLGVLDVGTNSVLMPVVENERGRPPLRLADLSRITRLGHAVDRTGRLDPQAAARTFDTIVEFTDQARALGAGNILAAGTSALRDAADGAEFIARLKARTGIDLELVSGETEAHLNYLAGIPARSGGLAGQVFFTAEGGGRRRAGGASRSP